MSKIIKSIGIVLCLISVYYCKSQNTISATYCCDIETNKTQYDPQCSGYLEITLPAGQSINIVSVQIEYDMTARNGGWIADQFSQIRFTNTNTYEPNEAYGPFIEAEGTHSYFRNINIANGVYPGGTVLGFELQAGRSNQGNGCNATYNKVDIESWIVTVIYADLLTVGIDKTSDLIARLEVVGVGKYGKTSAVFGADGAGISFQRNPAAIGFNQYCDTIGTDTKGKYLDNGFAASIELQPATLAFDVYTNGLKDQSIMSKKRVFSIGRNTTNQIQKVAFESYLDTTNAFGFISIQEQQRFIVKKESNNSAVSLAGSNHSTEFIYGGNENTYIRGGKNGSKVLINEDGNFSAKKNSSFSNSSIGMDGSNEPQADLEIHGGISISNHLSISSMGGNDFVIFPPNCSYIDLTGVNTNNQPVNNLSIELSYSIKDAGKIKIIRAKNNFILSFDGLPAPQGQPNPPISISMTEGDTATFLGRSLICFSNN